MSQSFECAWESARPVPHVTIDFGDGHVLERTLRGNIVTYLRTARGEVFDLIPGLVDAREYARRLAQALRLYRAGTTRMLLPVEPGTCTLDGSNGVAMPAPAFPDPMPELVRRWHQTIVD